MKSLGVLSILFIILCWSFMLYYWPLEKHKTLSQHAARQKSSIIYFATIYFVFLSLFAIFMYGWFIPQFNFGAFFKACLAIGIAMQVVAVLVPEIKGPKAVIHIAAATIMSLMALVIVAIFVFTLSLSHISHIICTLTLLGMIGGLLSLVFSQKVREHLLIGQLSYFILFLIAILSVTYLG